jgi:hypothetical protein
MRNPQFSRELPLAIENVVTESRCLGTSTYDGRNNVKRISEADRSTEVTEVVKIDPIVSAE